MPALDRPLAHLVRQERLARFLVQRKAEVDAWKQADPEGFERHARSERQHCTWRNALERKRFQTFPRSFTLAQVRVTVGFAIGSSAFRSSSSHSGTDQPLAVLHALVVSAQERGRAARADRDVATSHIIVI